MEQVRSKSPVELRLVELVNEINTQREDLLTTNLQGLWNIGAELGALLVNLGDERVRAEKEYNAHIAAIRGQEYIKTKADAELYASNSPEWEDAHRLQNLAKTSQEILLLIKLAIRTMNEQTRNQY